MAKKTEHRNALRNAKSGVSKEDRQATKAAKKATFGDFGGNMLADQVFSPEKARELCGWPITNGVPAAHVAPARQVVVITATADNQPFSVVVTQDPLAKVGVFQGDAQLTGVATGSWSFDSGTSLKGYGSYFRINRDLADNANYGALEPSPNFQQFLTPSPHDGDDTNVLSIRGPGGLSLTPNAEGVFDLGPNGAISSVSLVLSTSGPGEPPSTQDGLVLQAASAINGPFSTIANVTSAANAVSNMTINFNTTPGTHRYLKLQLQTNGVVIGGGSRSVLSMSLTMNVKNVRSTSYVWQAIPGVSALFDAETFTHYQCAATTVLATCTSSALTDGGRIAGSQLLLGPGEQAGEVRVRSVDEVASLLSAYEGPFKKGAWGFWTPTGQNDYATPYADATDNAAILVVSGIIAAAGGSIRFEVNSVTSYACPNLAGQIFNPFPSRVAPTEIYMVQEMVSHFRTHFCENPMHPKVQEMMKKASSMWKAGKPYLEVLAQAAKFALPLMLAI